MNRIETKIKSLPSEPGVYIMLDDRERIIYIGKAISLKNRVTQYFRSSPKPVKVQAMVDNIADFRYIITNNETDALILESNLIKKHKPKYNILLKDDKNYPFIRIDLTERFPRLEIVRRLTADKAKYFGPFMQGVSATALSDLVNAAFGLRTCKGLSSNKRACLKYHLGMCCAPCTDKCTQEEYAERIREAVDFLNGRDEVVRRKLTDRMNEASEREDYETALLMRDRLKILDKMVRHQITAMPKKLNLDCFAYYSDGAYSSVGIVSFRNGRMLGGNNTDVSDYISENPLISYITQYYYDERLIPARIVTTADATVLRRFFEEKFGKKPIISSPSGGLNKQIYEMALKNAGHYTDKILSLEMGAKLKAEKSLTQLRVSLKMEKLKRIECYDISNISGTDKVASMVVFENGEKRSAHYRRFRIKTVEGIDDFASMAEVISRRAAHFTDADESFSSVPELIVIDGGKGQLGSAYEAMPEEYRGRIKMIGLAKRFEEVFEVGKSEPLILPASSLALKLLQRVRDEAHRFAITYHRKLRADRQTRSVLLQIKGIGAAKIKKLFSAFGSLKAIGEADEEKLISVKGISRADAGNILEFFQRRNGR